MENHWFIHPVGQFFVMNGLGGDVQYINNLIAYP